MHTDEPLPDRDRSVDTSGNEAEAQVEFEILEVEE